MDERLKQLIVSLQSARNAIEELARGEYEARSTTELYAHLSAAAKCVLDAQKQIVLARIYP